MNHSRLLAIDWLHTAISTHRAPEFVKLDSRAYANSDDAAKQFAHAMVLIAFRHLGQINSVIGGFVKKPLPPSKQWVQAALIIGAVQILCTDTPAHAAVNETVQAVKKSKYAALSGMVNATLKNIAKQQPQLPDAALNIPQWLRPILAKQYDKKTLAAMAQIASHRPGYDVNTSLSTQSASFDNPAIHALNKRHIRISDEGILQPLLQQDAMLFVQDIAASYPVAMLGDIAQKHVLEIGAAPGGKTMQLLAKGAQVAALDRSRIRAKRLAENLDTRGLSAEIIVQDALEYTPPTPPDIVVLDAPCSATGTWRKHPEVLHLLTQKQLDELVILQRSLITQAVGWLAPKGQLLYCVCSLNEAEAEAQLAWALKTHKSMKIVPANAPEILPQAITENGCLRTHIAMLKDLDGAENTGGMDGFFAVLLEKAE
jgi:16S rRNA (cytosine967-C5)-methyltransferase